ncbi:MAG: type II toxin-antitoxin system VapB family antitoxin [Actinobacteria bacterium]|jgi:Arc/MetJ family transcription regulator|nr:type II toxin-antitoxin system VapB family antitoxin [Cyanobacteriota bacterium]MCL5772573.1 type II toxin-antitoxin system VapB family antitoxin [Actinomycetota bacterium]
MRTNIVLDDKLVEKGMAITGIKTKKELVNYALKSLIDRKKMYEILSLKGKVNWEGSIEDMRSNRKW